MMAAPLFANPPSVDDWQQIQVHVRSLYVHGKLPLKEVRAVLREEYGFKATERMIKARLKHWGYLKNAKKDDWYYLALLQHRRRARGRPATEFVVHGHRKTVRDLQRFIRNQNMTVDQFLREAQQRVRNKAVPSHIRASTPDDQDSAAHSDGHWRSCTPSPLRDDLSPSRRLSAEKGDSALSSSRQSPQPASQLHTPSCTRSSNEIEPSSPSHISPVDVRPDQHSSAPMSASPSGSCQQMRWEVELMSRQLDRATPLEHYMGDDDDLASWTWINNSPQSESSGRSSLSTDYVCSRCRRPSQEHFIEPSAVQSQPHNGRDILNGDDHTLHLPISTDGDGPWIWTSRCFLASICFTRQDQKGAEAALQDASREFERLLRENHTHLLTSALMVISMLHMHDQGSVAKTIMQCAADVAARVQQEDNPIRVTIEYFMHCANLAYNQTSSDLVRRPYEALSSILPRTHPYVITSQYNYMFMLKLEDRLQEAEQMARDCYATSCQVFGEDHMQSIFAQAGLAGCLYDDDARRDECIALYEEVIARSQSTLGRSHLYSLEATRRMAKKIEERDGVTSHTAGLYKSVLLGRARRLGCSHTFTIGARDDYEERLKILGRWEDRNGLPSRERNEIVRLFDRSNLDDRTGINHKRQRSAGSQDATLIDVDEEWFEAVVKRDENGWDDEAKHSASPTIGDDYLTY